MSDKKFFYFGILPALFFQMNGAALYFLWDTGFSQGFYILTKLLLLIWPLIWLKSAHALIPHWNARKGLVTGIALGVLKIATVPLVFLFLDLSFISGAAHEKAAQFGLVTPGFYILFAVFFSVFHAMLEEYYWRWFVFRGLLLKFDWKTAALIGSAAFAGHHYFVLSEFFPLPFTLFFGTGVGVAGFIWCALYRKYHSLLAPYISHVFVDAVLMVIGYTILF